MNKHFFSIKNPLNHKAYCWPETMLTYDFEKTDADNLVLRDQNGNSVPFQISNNGKICFLTSLDWKDNKIFSLCKEEKHTKDNLSVHIAKTDSGFGIRFKEITFNFEIDNKDWNISLIENGSVYCEYIVETVIDKECKYEIYFKFISGMPFFEMKEKITGNPPDNVQLCISTGDFLPKYRYSYLRDIEKIDSYLDNEKNIPVTIMPYENWNAWFQSKYIGFSDGKTNSGVFIRDNAEWDSGQYKIWESDNDFGIKFSHVNGQTKWIYPIKEGKRFTAIAVYPNESIEYIAELWKWYSFLNLNEVKDFILEWEEDKNQYPLYWKDDAVKNKKTETFDGLVGEFNFDKILTHSQVIEDVSAMGPVSQREFADWTVVFDTHAERMSKTEFDRFKAFFAFFAYLAMSENYMPTKNMLAGHPNFLIDNASVAGFAAAMFPNHPHRQVWIDYFNKCVELNMKYHVRPDIKIWKSKGGRHTENLGCYNLASLVPMTKVLMLFEKADYPLPFSNPWIEKWLGWMTNSLTAPVAGRRLIPPQGAHSGRFHDGYIEIPYSYVMIAKLLEKYYPETARNMLFACNGSKLVVQEMNDFENNPWRMIGICDLPAGIPNLKSEKYTGYGYILRNNVGKDNEISVHIQQLDKGPNYRWGTFENTGNGSIHYYASGKRYSFNEAEHTGDMNLGAAEGDCGFAVLYGHTYHNIGFNELINPLIDFGFAQSVTLNADNDISHLYKYRNVILSGSEYIALYDRVDDITTRGRFSWFVNKNDEFPNIIPIKPQVDVVDYQLKGPVDFLERGKSLVYEETEQKASFTSKGKGMDGNGDFLTIVSHCDMSVEKKENYITIELSDRTDFLFDDDSVINEKLNNVDFCGKRAVYSEYKNGCKRIAVFEGVSARLLEMFIAVQYSSFSVEYESGRYSGMLLVYSGECVTFEFGGNIEKIVLAKGSYRWNIINNKLNIFMVCDDYQYEENTEFNRDVYQHEFGFNGFDFRRPKLCREYPFDK